MKAKLFDFVGVGGIAYDMVLRVDSLPKNDGKYSVQHFERLAGGLVANTTIAAAKLGLKSGFVGWVGKDSGGDLLINNFEQNAIDTQGTQQIEGEETPFTIIMVDAQGERAILLPSFPVYQANLTSDQIKYLQQAQYIYTSFRDMDWCFKLSTFAKEVSSLFILDIETHDQLNATELKQVAAMSDIIFLSQGVMENAKIDNIQDIKSQQWTIVTSGSEGSTGYDFKQNAVYHQSAYKVKAVDTTGAGDVFHAGCIAAHKTSKSLQDSLQYGAAAAAIAVQYHGARGGLPDAKQVQDWIDNQQ